MIKEITIIGGAGHVGLAFALICTSKNIKVHIHDINKIRYHLLDEIDILVSSGITDADKNLGALWVLTALTIVSPDCASSLPWLMQI